MRFVVDAQLPPALAEWLCEKGHDAVAVRDIGLRDADDRTIWERTVIDHAAIVTKDEDFTLITPGSPDSPQILWVRTGNLVNRLLLARFEQAWPQVEAHLSAMARVVEMR